MPIEIQLGKMPETFLRDLIVVELGDRPAVGACGSLLAQLGTTVILVENVEQAGAPATKRNCRSLVAAGKKSLQINPESKTDRAMLERLLGRADVLLMSSDMQPPWAPDAKSLAKAAGAFICDLSAFGSSGPLAGRAYSDALVQAMAGAMDTTGSPEGAPIPTQVPIMEFPAAIYATAGILAGLRARSKQGISQSLEVSLHDTGMNMLSSFLAAYFVGREPGRIGNHHPSMSPWDLYRTRDGWALICAGSDEQWHRMCRMFDRPELITDARFASPTMRVKNRAEIDQIVEGWTKELTTADCIDRFNAAAIASGPVNTVTELFADPGLNKDGMFCGLADPTTGATICMPGSLFKGSICQGRTPSNIPRADDDRTFIQTLVEERCSSRTTTSVETAKPPLAGVRVVEIGNYTTAPLAGRQLGALGAYVVKVEAPSGDLGRSLPPLRDGQGYFFTLGNSDKRSIMLDLRTDQGKLTFRELLAKADILLENLKAGSLARLGFSTSEIARINPGLVHCAITGFGMDSPYSDRAAMDTTIQGMSGIMDLTRAADGVPYKTGISIADLAGGQLALVAALAGLTYRDRTGRGQVIDLSMHAVSAWLTHSAWNLSLSQAQSICLIRCTDGYVVAESDRSEAAFAIAGASLHEADPMLLDAAEKTRDEIVALLSQRTIVCAPVLRVSEAAQHPQTTARGSITAGLTASGLRWPLLACPLRYSKTPATVRRAIGPAGADAAEIIADWGLADGC